MENDPGPVTKFAKVRFRETDTRTYTYDYAGLDLQAGDMVKVPARDGSGWSRAQVVETDAAKPAFATKRLLGKIIEDGEETDGEKA